jgi:hypothetical protein
MLDFASRAEAASRPGMEAALVGLMGASELESSVMRKWLPQWKSAFEVASAGNRVEARIHPVRVNYYEKAFEAMLGSENPRAALWPLLRTWTLAADALPENELEAWRAACGELGLGWVGFDNRVSGLDHFLDEVEALLDELAAQHGLETSTSI